MNRQQKLVTTAAPNLPLAPSQYQPQHFDIINNVLRLYFNQLDRFSSAVINGGPFENIDFITDSTIADKLGRLKWNVDDATLNLGMEYGVVQQIGQETYARVRNTTGTTINNGAVVGFAGASEDAINVAPYLADGSSPSLYILGVMTHDLPDSGEKGYCCTWGFVRGLDTSAFTQGDVLYASPTVAGALTNVKPTAPDNVVPVAAAIKIDATEGVVFVRPSIDQMQYYGNISATTDQLVAAADTAYAVTFNSTDLTNGVTIGTPASRIVVPVSGLYNFQVVLQLSSTSGSSKTFWCWYRKNGVDIANSALLSTIKVNGDYLSITLDRSISMNMDDYVEIMYAANDTGVYMEAVPATAFAPAGPAVNLIVVQTQQ